MRKTTPKSKLRVVTYSRVSTDEQAEHGFSLAAQRDRLRMYAGAQGWKLQDELVDDGYSGRNSNRPAYRRLLETRDQWDILLVARMDRIHRNSRNFLDMMDLLESEGKVFASVNESLDTSTAIGRFVMSIIAGIAQLESGQLGERLVVAIEQKYRTTNKLHGPRSFGYRKKNGTLVPHPKEAEVVRWMCQQTLAGIIPTRIALALNKKKIKSRNGNPWTGSSIARLLSHPIIAGCRLSAKHPKLNTHPPLVDMETFWRVQEILDWRRTKHRPDAKNTHRARRLDRTRELMA